eukprot:scaffold241965_cov24-Tisochrysis_lutea.AAC.1
MREFATPASRLSQRGKRWREMGVQTGRMAVQESLVFEHEGLMGHGARSSCVDCRWRWLVEKRSGTAGGGIGIGRPTREKQAIQLSEGPGEKGGKREAGEKGEKGERGVAAAWGSWLLRRERGEGANERASVQRSMADVGATEV